MDFLWTIVYVWTTVYVWTIIIRSVGGVSRPGGLFLVLSLCSFENLSSLDVNKSGIVQVGANLLPLKNNAYFRKGEVGDWKNHLTLEMATRLDQITEQKLNGSGLTLHFSSNA